MCPVTTCYVSMTGVFERGPVHMQHTCFCQHHKVPARRRARVTQPSELALDLSTRPRSSEISLYRPALRCSPAIPIVGISRAAHAGARRLPFLA